ncbi:metallophosphoesterase family protein [Clostridium sp. BL-8]|uniref:metallophosphoesterase family protein n=1 Tax=Clostridium sp. BL-8 TaxID=349938 RepID=UPI00098CDF75|nr:metallophosphoesterase family protein [Clostridium sp. BL-8]OOM78802.1 serine/threonine-protein phosphatase 2 [Clostridium sp. BL-8]
MSKYVISDIHGCYEEFIKMMDLINFKEDDELFILGDVIDRGHNPLEIIDYIMSHSNISLIKGNHEEIFIDYYNGDEPYAWFFNGGKTTYDQLEERGTEYAERLYKYISSLPLIKVIDKYILVHSTLDFIDNYNDLSLEVFLNKQEENICLWGRENIGEEKQYKDYTVICGHTPVQVINETKRDEEVKILYRKGTIYIDCGCFIGKHEGGKLACLRLDDKQEFYVKSID